MTRISADFFTMLRVVLSKIYREDNKTKAKATEYYYIFVF